MEGILELSDPSDLKNKKFKFTPPKTGEYNISYLVSNDAGAQDVGILRVFAESPDASATQKNDVTYGDKIFLAPLFAADADAMSVNYDGVYSDDIAPDDSGSYESIATFGSSKAQTYCSSLGARLPTRDELVNEAFFGSPTPVADGWPTTWHYLSSDVSVVSLQDQSEVDYVPGNFYNVTCVSDLPYTMTLVATDDEAEANGSDWATAQVTLLEADGDAIVGETLNASVDGSATLENNAVTTNSQGVAEFRVKNSVVETVTLSVDYLNSRRTVDLDFILPQIPFDITTVSSGNTSGANGKIKYLDVGWESAAQAGETNINYTLCQFSPQLPDECLALNTITDSLSMSANMPSILGDVLTSQIFVKAEHDSWGNPKTTPLASIPVDVVNDMIGYIKPSDGAKYFASNDIHSVTLSGDGQTLFVGNGTVNKIYVYKNNNGEWLEESIFNGHQDAGINIVTNYDGTVLASISYSLKKLYIYSYNSGVWNEEHTATFSGPSNINELEVSGDGKTVVLARWDILSGVSFINTLKYLNNMWGMVSAIQGDENNPYSFSGDRNLDLDFTGDYLVAATSHTIMSSTPPVHTFSFKGSQWIREQDIVSPNPDEPEFGVSLDLSSDGTTLAISAPSNDSGVSSDPTDTTAIDSGGVYIYKRSGSSWVKKAFIKPDWVQAGQKLGMGVDLSASGNKIVCICRKRR